MVCYLLDTVERYRVATVADALQMRDEMSNMPEYDIQSFTYTTKFDKKTEEEYQVVKVKKIINPEKDATSGVKVHYEY